MKKILLTLLLLVSFSSFSQKQADKWYFGLNAGVDFSTGTAVALTNGALNTSEGCSTVSDASGNLLFYTDGVSVWNKNHVVMPNGTGLMGNVSSTQSGLIVPKPGSNTIYYVFTVEEIGNFNGFRYSVVDMSLDAGQGDLISKNTAVLTPVDEKLTAVKESFGNNYWVAVHEWGNNSFYSYRLTTSGLGTPVISKTGIVHSLSKIQYTYGQMKFSPCGNKIGVAAGYTDTIQVFDFNDLTGVISNPLTLPAGAHIYGLEFSPDGTKLYVSTYDPSATLVQYDLTLGSAAAIKASKVSLSTTTDIYGLQVANNGKIYACVSFNTYLGVINSPNTAGTGCNYVDMGLNLDPNSTGINSGLTLPGFVQSLAQESSCLQVGIKKNEKEPNNIQVFPNPFKEYITIQNSTGGISLVTIYSLQGKEIFSEQLHGSQTVSPSNLPRGTYLLSVQTAEGNFNYRISKY